MGARIFTIGTLCDIGSVKKSNQDSILVKIGEDSSGEFGLFVVADGMGGLAYGDMASEMITNEFRKWWNDRLSLILQHKEHANIDFIDTDLRILINNINNKILDFSNTIKDKIGSTLSMLFIFKDQYIIKHIGDSRIYLLNSSEMQQLTQDHSWVAEQVAQGSMTKEEARQHPKRNILTRCIGITENIELFETSGRLTNDASFLLCSDGLYNFVLEDEIFNAINEYKLNTDCDIQDIASMLLKKVKSRGASDNVSMIVICQNNNVDHEKLLSRFKRFFSKSSKISEDITEVF
ncbi:MAG: protein phosphatase 2C domain-containing protein [Clostridia bacterium]|nr:protein phosphatase 2C domain-containing protein [Clostridia bacterium]